MNSTILKKIINNMESHPESQALWVDHVSYTYRELVDRARSLAALFLEYSDENAFCAIYSDKNIFSFQSILATLLAGKAYVPLNPHLAVERSITMLNEVSCEIICVDVKEDLAVDFLKRLTPTRVCLFRKSLYDHLVKTVPQHDYLYWTANDYKKITPRSIVISPEDYAYLMFTSGSTGKPKGIAIQHGNLSQYIHSICDIYQPNRDDRFSQLCELTFDLSVHEIFVCWAAGAALYVIPDSYILGIKRFIQTHAITCWTSVPSNITLLYQLKQLSLQCFPSLKLSFFCGEAFLTTQAAQWKKVAPNSVIANLYGPTEATVTFTYFNWQPDDSELSGVPIGIPFPEQQCCLIDDNQQRVKSGEMGELCLAGSQVIHAYWNNPAKSAHAFKKFLWDKTNTLWYRTGDLAKWDEKVGYIYHGRIDDQWQIRGYRVEKLEIENALRKIAKNDNVAIVPLQTAEGQVEGFVAFISNDIDAVSLMTSARQSLPNPMVPRQIHSIATLPQNANGKIDYISLKKYLSQKETTKAEVDT